MHSSARSKALFSERSKSKGQILGLGSGLGLGYILKQLLSVNKSCFFPPRHVDVLQFGEWFLTDPEQNHSIGSQP